jgi:hypothetical protein
MLNEKFYFYLANQSQSLASSFVYVRRCKWSIHYSLRREDKVHLRQLIIITGSWMGGRTKYLLSTFSYLPKCDIRITMWHQKGAPRPLKSPLQNLQIPSPRISDLQSALCSTTTQHPVSSPTTTTMARATKSRGAVAKKATKK